MKLATRGGRFVDSVALGLGLGAVLITAGAVFGDRQEASAEIRGRYHKIILPSNISDLCEGCAAEAAAYASALAALEAAQDVADEMYDDWYNCLMNEDPQPEPDPGKTPKTISILEHASSPGS
ncbi:MAG: hypothetical protein KDB22_14770 [Planctomycetales bacterium]|nr:hypothetical protein [Planctomycetales bacterium]